MKTFARFLQMAYVTSDFDRALAEFRDSHGIARFLEMRNMNSELLPGRFASLHVGLAWVGDTQIELIAPLGGDDEVYRNVLPADEFAIRFHHIGQHVDSKKEYQRLLDDAAVRDIPIVIRSTSYFYLDMRKQLGHYMEYVSNSPEDNTAQRRAIIEQIPRN